MQNVFNLVKPRMIPVLDPNFRPPALANRAFHKAVEESGGGVPLAIAVERDMGKICRFDTCIFVPEHPMAAANYTFVERTVKFLLWQWGGWKIYVGGSPDIANFIAECYSPKGSRTFDAQLWGEQVYQQKFTVLGVDLAETPEATEMPGAEVKVDWTGWRIGFDLGASDRKVAVVKDGKLALDSNGKPVLSEEYPWDPKPQTEPSWHFDKIMEILKRAEEKIKKVQPDATIQAIGGSSAGIYVNGRARIASLFRGIQPRERFEQEIAPLFSNIQKAWDNIPFRLENDGDVTALAGSVALGDGAVLGLAMGSSLAAGYVDDRRCIAGWMNELAFAPVDYNPSAPADEWSEDIGVGVNYLSQQAVGRLIPVAGIDMPDIDEDNLPERLVRIQELMADNDPRARKIYETIGRYFGYTIAHFRDFYNPVRHIEVLGRVMTGEGGQIILKEVQEVLNVEFPDLAKTINFYEPSEQEKRHGQAVAAAHLPIA